MNDDDFLPFSERNDTGMIRALMMLGLSGDIVGFTLQDFCITAWFKPPKKPYRKTIRYFDYMTEDEWKDFETYMHS